MDQLSSKIYRFSMCLMAAIGAKISIRGPTQLITVRIFALIAGV